MYWLQPPDYPLTIYYQLQQVFAKRGRHIRLLTCDQIATCPKDSIYFIIKDEKAKDWDSLAIAKTIRQKDSFGRLVLLSKTIDYPTLFQSHLAFWTVLELTNLDTEVQELLKDPYFQTEQQFQNPCSSQDCV